MLSKQLFRQEYPIGKKPKKSQIALVLAVNLFTVFLKHSVLFQLQTSILITSATKNVCINFGF